MSLYDDVNNILDKTLQEVFGKDNYKGLSAYEKRRKI